MFCPKCGNSIPDGNQFCQNCGFHITQTAVPSAEPVQTVSPAPAVQPAQPAPTAPSNGLPPIQGTVAGAVNQAAPAYTQQPVQTPAAAEIRNPANNPEAIIKPSGAAQAQPQQPQYNAQQPQYGAQPQAQPAQQPKKKGKTLLFIGIAAVAILAVLYLFGSGMIGGGGGGNDLLSRTWYFDSYEDFEGYSVDSSTFGSMTGSIPLLEVKSGKRYSLLYDGTEVTGRYTESDATYEGYIQIYQFDAGGGASFVGGLSEESSTRYMLSLVISTDGNDGFVLNFVGSKTE